VLLQAQHEEFFGSISVHATPNLLALSLSKSPTVFLQPLIVHLAIHTRLRSQLLRLQIMRTKF
jgi:hypothetical protein